MADPTAPLPAGRVGGPCDWPFDVSCCPGLDMSTIADPLMDMAKTWVAEILWSATGRRFGLCDMLVRPCNRGCLNRLPLPMPTVMGDRSMWPTPYLYGGQWFNSCGCIQYSDCSCGPLCELALPGPIDSITEVLIDGEVIDPATYRVDNHRLLVRLGGEECWPRCQHMDANIDEPGSFAISYRRGTPVPEGGAYVAGIYLGEVLKQCIGDKSCRLPRNVTQVNRAGITTNFSAGGGKFAGLTQLPEVDMWINLVNPNGLASASDVWSPDNRARVRTATAPRDVMP